MADGKALGHNGIPIEFFRVCWHIVGEEFFAMIAMALDKGEINPRITKGLVILIPKEGDLLDLNYWRPITLLTAIYEDIAKVMQLRLQPALMEVISYEQSTFLPLQFILDNILLVQETLY